MGKSPQQLWTTPDQGSKRDQMTIAGVGVLLTRSVRVLIGITLNYAAYNDCRNGFSVDEATTNFNGAPPWSEKWFGYCTAKYRSFNPETGHFTTYGEEQKFCVYQESGKNDGIDREKISR